MKKFFLLLFATAALAACDDKNETQPVVTGIVLDRNEAALNTGETLQLTATVTPSDAADPVVWSSDDTSVATVSDSGLVEALAVGTATVTAKCGNFTASCAIQVEEHAAGIELDRTEAVLDAGATLQLTATVTPSDAVDPVEWSSDNLAVATVSDSGLVEALTAGTATVTAKCGDFTAACVVSVSEVAQYDVISFEAEEGMTAIDGMAVTLGEIEVVGGFAAAKYENAFWAQPYAAEYGDPDGSMGVTYDAPLFTSDNVWFGSYYCDFTAFGSRMDTWGGFVLSQNCNTTATSFDYQDQFSVYAASGANSTKTFAVAYCNGMMGGEYSNPVIEFAVSPRQVDHLYLAASTMLYSYYKYGGTVPRDRTFGYKITGSLDGGTVGSVSVELVKNSTPVEDWVKVDLSGLGKVDKLVFTPDGINPNMDSDPVYFCLDEIALVKE